MTQLRCAQPPGGQGRYLIKFSKQRLYNCMLAIWFNGARRFRAA
jgi:hypothetical protein